MNISLHFHRSSVLDEASFFSISSLNFWMYALNWTSTSFQSSNDPRLFFGLGTEASHVEVRWPSGRVDLVGPLVAGRRVRLVEGVGVVREERLP